MISLHDHDRDRDLTDGDIIRYVDRECQPEEAQRIAAHMARCDTCRERVEVLERRLGVLSSLLGEADFAPGERAPRRTWQSHSLLKAAAMVFVTLGLGFTVAPVRAWVVDTWLSVVDGADPAVVDDGVGVPGYGIVSFVVNGASLSIEVEMMQSGGELHVRSADVGLASARVEGGDGSEELVVLPGVLRVVSGATSGANYHVVVPMNLAGVSVRIGGGEPRNFSLDDLGGGGRSFDLKGLRAP